MKQNKKTNEKQNKIWFFGKISEIDQRALKLVKSIKGSITTKFTEQRLLWNTIVNK